MNRHVEHWAETTRLRMEESQWRDRWAAKHPPVPLPLMAKVWPHVSVDADGPLAWPSYRWPLNSSRWVMTHAWSDRWDTSDRSRFQRPGKALWVIATAVVGLFALIVAAVLTTVGSVVYVAANVAGFCLIVFGGWAHRSATLRLGDRDLAVLRAGVDAELHEPYVPGFGERPVPVNAGNPAEFNNAGDAVLQAQVDATAAQRELIDHQRVLMAHDVWMTNHDQSPGPAVAASPAARDGGRAPRQWPAVLVKWAAAALIIVWLLSALGRYVGVEPPTFAEIHAGINERMEQRQADTQARFEEVVGE